MRNYPYRLCELYLLAWTQRGYEVAIKDAAAKLREDIIPNVHTIGEISFRKSLEDLRNQIEIVPRFAEVPIVSGVRGWNDTEYSKPWSAKFLARRLAQLIAPSLWI